MLLSEINIYPIKSLKGISLDSAVVEERGLRHDRRWMLTTPDGMFFTQREFPTMALISVEMTGDGLRVTKEGSGEMNVPFQPDKGERKTVLIWRSVCEGLIYSGEVSEWFSDAIGTDCRLVYMPDDSRRSVNPLFNKNDDVVSFADGYPLMVLSGASLDDLNERIASRDADEGVPVPLPMNRFRPNIVVNGCDAFAEDNWRQIQIGDAIFRSTKPCERCVITTVDQAKGEVAGKEPLTTLASYRMAKNVMPDRYESLGVGANAVLFGQNLIAESVGATISVGDDVEIFDM
jgi:uncharacterized protein YcbX